MSDSVLRVVMEGMCIGCGLCELACASGAIAVMHDRDTQLCSPVVDTSRCRSCGRCLEVCFGASLKYSGERTVADLVKSSMGTCIRGYSGWATEKGIRFRASSGGVVTSLLISLLERKIVDGVVVTKLQLGNLPMAKAMIARNRAEVEEAMGSKYLPVCLVDAIRSMKKSESYAVVGLPCHVFAVRRLQEVKRINGRIVACIGLFCGGTPNGKALRYLLRGTDISEDKIRSIEYRGGGWPGMLRIKTQTDTLEMPYMEYGPIISPWFHLDRCSVCLIGFNPEADISCGDFWQPNLAERNKQGMSAIVSRSQIAERILQEARNNGSLNTEQVPLERITGSQKGIVESKFESFPARMRTLYLLRGGHLFAGRYAAIQIPFSRRQTLNALIIQIGHWLARNECRWCLLDSYRRILHSIGAFMSTRG